MKLDALAADVQAQAGRLRQRLSAAPAPQGQERNPFTFSSSQAATVARAPVVRAAAPPSIAPAPVEIPEPVLQLIGVAEDTKAGTLVRTAMITGGYDELMMVVPGQRVLNRYEVMAVGADAVELKDLETGATRRLVLR